MNRLPFLLLLAVILLAGAGLRLWQLDSRLMHHDEANQALRCQPLLENGIYHYDAVDHHGPTLYYLALPGLRLTCGKDFTASSEQILRAVTAVAGIIAILLLLCVRGALGDMGTVAAMACAALSPGLIYFSRFFIQEMILVALTAMLLAAVWRQIRTPTRWGAALIGMAAGSMLATKETSVLTFAALVVGALAVFRMRSLRLPPSHIAWASVAFILTLVMFFSSFGTNWQGLADLIAAIPVYLHRAGGGGHDHPWWFYFNMLGRYEWPILLLAGVGVVAAWRDGRQEPAAEFLRLLAVAMPVLMAIYAIIPYKTPWCIMTPLFLAAIMAGHGLAFLIGQARSWRGLVWWPAFGVALIIMGHTAWELSFVARGDPRNRYAYVETSQDLAKLMARIEQFAAVHPLGRQLVVAVVSPLEDTWPLPWYLRRFHRTGYWTSASNVPANLVPDLVIGAAEESEAIAARLGADRHSSFFGLRPGVPIMLHCNGALWQHMLEAHSRAKR